MRRRYDGSRMEMLRKRKKWLDDHRDMWELGTSTIVKAMKLDGLYAPTTAAVDTIVARYIGERLP